jgi:hypothetical protein
MPWIPRIRSTLPPPIGQELDVPDSLLQLIEGGLASHEQRATVGRRLNTTRAAIEQSHADSVLELGNDARDSRLRDSQLRRSLGHAAESHDAHEYVQMAQLEAAADLPFPIDFPCHTEALLLGDKKHL